MNILLVDYGGVLGFDHIIEKEELLAHELGLSQVDLNNRISEKSVIGRLYREHKLTEVEFWRQVGPTKVIDEEIASRLTQMWMDTYALNTDMLNFLQGLRKTIKVGILTNIDEGRSNLLTRIVGIEDNMDIYFPSYRYGYSKDNSKLWRMIARELEGNQVIYVDDRPEHVQSANAVGWKGIKYFDLEVLKRQLGEI